MKRAPLWKLSITVTPDRESAASDELSRCFGLPVASYTDLATGMVTLTAYSEKKPKWSPARKSSSGKEQAQRQGQGSSGLDGLRISRVRREDWADSWKRHFPAIAIGSALLVKPSWVRRRPRKGQALVVLDPGLSFGTGQHPTTAFCLQQIVSRRKAGQSPSLLDLGTGSGILAIAAAKLGYGLVEGLDYDREAVVIARANARRNRVANRIRFAHADVTRLPRIARRRYAVVCANLISTLLITERDRILARLQPDGVLVLAGILKTEFDSVRKVYEAAGLRLVASRTQKEWRSGSFAAVERTSRASRS